MNCEYCEKEAVYTCSRCGEPLCVDHVKLRTVCTICLKKAKLKYSVRKAVSKEERSAIRGFVTRFWGEQEQLTFDRHFTVTGLPAYVARTSDRTIGFVSFAQADDATIIVALGVLPKYQCMGIGKRLIEAVEREAAKKHKKRLLVSTSNDDLPALAFYQSIGFQIYAVKPNVIAEKHGSLQKGIAGLPVRDELRLQKNLSQQLRHE
jgi:ribosomal protein S18 acetylase RimI-like enzyme